MLHIYEFEVFESEGWYLALPYDMAGGTQGTTLAEVCEMAAEWLKMEMEHRAMHRLDMPEATFGHEPSHEGGRTVIVAVEAGLNTVRKVSAADAARMLGVTRGRISQMIAANKLEAFRDEWHTWVTLDSVEARLADTPKAGRPARKAVTA